MLLGFKTQLKVNKQQRLLLAQHAGVRSRTGETGRKSRLLLALALVSFFVSAVKQYP
ncbi:MAG: hypothetical protein ACKO9I_02350 [Sphaerospermopsis kisseleviana]